MYLQKALNLWLRRPGPEGEQQQVGIRGFDMGYLANSEPCYASCSHNLPDERKETHLRRVR